MAPDSVEGVSPATQVVEPSKGQTKSASFEPISKTSSVTSLVFVGAANGLNEETLFGMAGDDRRSGVSTLGHVREMVEAKAIVCFFAAVTFETGPHEDGADFLFEEFDLFGLDLSGESG